MSGVVAVVFPREGGLQTSVQPTRKRTSCFSSPQQINQRFQAESGWSSILTPLGSGHQKPAWNLPGPNVPWKTPDDGQRRYPKHVEFYNRIKLDN
jgi:hypothetical protein